MTKKQKKLNFEQLIGELEGLVEALETGDLALEDALSTFEKGIKLTKECQQQLAEAQQKVSLLVGDGENMELLDFEDEGLK